MLLLVDHEASHGAHHRSTWEHDKRRLEECGLLQRRRILYSGILSPLFLLVEGLLLLSVAFSVVRLLLIILPIIVVLIFSLITLLGPFFSMHFLNFQLEYA